MTSAIKPAATRVLTDSELDTVVGGTSSSDWISWTRLVNPSHTLSRQPGFE
jgi:hypothetical protein